MSYRVPARLAWIASEGRPGESGPLVYLLQLPDGEPQVLHGSAALIWIVAAEGDADVPCGVAELTGAPVDEVRDPTEDYLRRLVTDGLLEGAP